MRYLVLITFSALCLLVACTKDSVQTAAELQNQQVGDRTNQKVTICHKTGNGSYHAIEVSPNAVPAHLAHGDYLPDADGDGYTAIGACTGSMDDCDDNNADIHPGAEEVCDNGIDDNCDGNIDEGCCVSCCLPFFTEETFEGANYVYYYDLQVNNCDGYTSDEVVLILTDQFLAYVISDIGSEIQVVGFLSEEGGCSAVVGVDITQADFDAALALLREIIASNPIPNYCGDCVACVPNSPQMAHMKTLLSKIKTGKLPTAKSQ